MLSNKLFKDILENLGVSDSDLQKLNKELLGDNAESNQEEATLVPMEVKIEQHQGCLYAFKLDSDEFLGQGKTREELIARLHENLSNVKVIVAEENGAALIRAGE